MNSSVRFTAFAASLGAAIFAAPFAFAEGQLATTPPPLAARPSGTAIASAAPSALQAPPPARLAQSQPAQPAPPQEEPAAPKIPTHSEVFRFDGWIVTCNEFEGGPKTRLCSAVLQIFEQKSHQAMFSWTVGLGSNKQVVAIFQTPTGVAIAPGLELRIGDAPGRKIPFASCDTGHCVATLKVDAVFMKEMTTAPTAHAVIHGEQGNTVEFNIEIKGFDKAYAVMSKPV